MGDINGPHGFNALLKAESTEPQRFSGSSAVNKEAGNSLSSPKPHSDSKQSVDND